MRTPEGTVPGPGQHGQRRPPSTSTPELHAGHWLREWLGVERLAPRAEVEARLRPGWIPERPGVAFCSRCGCTIVAEHTGVAEGCPRCQGTRWGWERLVRLGPYVDPWRGWVHAIKFERNHVLGYELGRRLGRAVAAQVDEVSGMDGVVPVPMPWLRRMHRGIDHAATIAGGVADACGLELLPILRRSRRPPQRMVTREARRGNVRGTVALRRWAEVGGLSLVVVDDVSTTRATLRETVSVLRRAGAARVVVAVLAATDPPELAGAGARDAVGPEAVADAAVREGGRGGGGC